MTKQSPMPGEPGDLEQHLRTQLRAAYHAGTDAGDPQQVAARVRAGLAVHARRRRVVTSVGAAAAVVALTAGVTFAVNGQRDDGATTAAASQQTSTALSGLPKASVPGGLVVETGSGWQDGWTVSQQCGSGELPKVNSGWNYLPDAPITPREPAVSVWTGSKLLVVGRATDERCSKSDARQGAAYDPKAKSWDRLPDAPFPIGGDWKFGSVWTGSELVAWSGRAGTAVYDPAKGTWRAAGPLPFEVRENMPDNAVSHPVQTVWDGKRVVVIAQDVKRPNSINVAAFDPATLRWTELPSIELPAGHNADYVAAAALTQGSAAGSVYLRIGWLAQADDPQQSADPSAPAAPRPSAQPSAAASGENGGGGQGSYGTVSYRLAPAADAWAPAPTIGLPDDYGQLYAAGDRLVWTGQPNFTVNPDAWDGKTSHLSLWTMRFPDGAAQRVKAPVTTVGDRHLEPSGPPIWTGDGLIYPQEYTVEGGAMDDVVGDKVQRWSLRDNSWATVGRSPYEPGATVPVSLVWSGQQLLGWGVTDGPVRVDTTPASPASSSGVATSAGAPVQAKVQEVLGVGLAFTPTDK